MAYGGIFICQPFAGQLFSRSLKSRKKFLAKIVATLFAIAGFSCTAAADDEVTAANIRIPQNSRFGFFDCLDHRSGYYQDAFPEPLLLDETSLEPDGELELNYLHTGAGQLRSDLVGVEAEKSFGVVTFDVEVPYQLFSHPEATIYSVLAPPQPPQQRFSESEVTAQGFGNIELSARSPFYQYVSANGLIDTTAGVDLDVGIPVNSQVSQNTEFEPAVFDDLKFGNHFTLQAMVGYDELFGGGDEGGSEEFEYGLDFGYAVPRADLPIPGVADISPMFEVDGELGLNQDDAGQNSVLGGIGFRLDFQPIAGLDPSLGLGYVFPMSSAARDAVHWGIVTSFTVEF